MTGEQNGSSSSGGCGGGASAVAGTASESAFPPVLMKDESPEARAYYRKEVAVKLWLERVLDLGQLPIAYAESELRDGVLLCRLMAALRPGSIPCLYDSDLPAPRDYAKIRSNILFFLEAAADYGVPKYAPPAHANASKQASKQASKHARQLCLLQACAVSRCCRAADVLLLGRARLFTVDDLYKAENVPRVVCCITRLGQLASQRPDWLGPKYRTAAAPRSRAVLAFARSARPARTHRPSSTRALGGSCVGSYVARHCRLPPKIDRQTLEANAVRITPRCGSNAERASERARRVSPRACAMAMAAVLDAREKPAYQAPGAERRCGALLCLDTCIALGSAASLLFHR